MSDEARDVALRELCDHKAGKYLSKDQYSGGGPFPVFGSNSVMGSHTRFLFEGPLSVLARIGSKCGAVMYSAGPCWVNNNASALVARDGVDARWLHALLSTMPMDNFRAGSGQPFIRVEDLLSAPVSAPPLAEQRRIAGVLGALDDLIEVNRGLIRDLVRMADLVAMSMSSSGQDLSFGEVCDVFGGGTPSTKNEAFWGGDVRWATPTDMTALPSPYLFDTSRHITAAGLHACASKLMPKGSILMTSRATIGAFAVAQSPTAVNQGFIAVEPRQEIDRWFLFHEMRRRVPEFIKRAHGSTFIEISRGVFKGLTVQWPSEGIRADLFAKVDPLHAAAASLQQEIAQLEQTRDELLPLLMSGRVRVAEEVAA